MTRQVFGGMSSVAFAVALGLTTFWLALDVRAQGGPPPGGAPFVLDFENMAADRLLVDRFDADDDGRLNAEERKAARAWMATQPPTGLAMVAARLGGPGGPGGRGGRGFGGRTFAPTSTGRRLTPADVRTYTDEPLYDTGVLRTIFLQFESGDWEQELADFYRTDVEVPATAIVDGKTYPDVGVHFRGMSSFFMTPTGSKRSLNLSFDDLHDDQALLGYRTLNLLNVANDPTFVRAMLYGEISRQYIAAPETNYVRVVINGESWGVYVSVEQFNADYVRDRFGSKRGARWKVSGSPFGQGTMAYLGEDADAYKHTYQIKTKDDKESWSDLIHLFRVLNQTPAPELEAALSPLLDIDGALKFLALEIAMVNGDGYWTRASDYNIYQGTDGRFHVLPHDINEGFGAEGGEEADDQGGRGRGARGFSLPPGVQLPAGFQLPATMGAAGVDLDPLVGADDPARPLRSKLLAVPALRARYLSYVREIADRWLDWTVLEPIVARYQGLIADDVMMDTRKLYSSEAFRTDVAEGTGSLKSFVDRRRAFLLRTP